MPFSTMRASAFSICERPFFAASRVTSVIATERPLCAQICAMPFPIVPAPITRTFEIIRVSSCATSIAAAE